MHGGVVMLTRFLWSLATLAVVSLAAAHLRADTIRIDDLTNKVTVTAGIPAALTILPDSGGEFVHFFYDTTLFSAATQTYSGTMTGPPGGDDPPGTISDKWWL